MEVRFYTDVPEELKIVTRAMSDIAAYRQRVHDDSLMHHWSTTDSSTRHWRLEYKGQFDAPLEYNRQPDAPLNAPPTPPFLSGVQIVETAAEANGINSDRELSAPSASFAEPSAPVATATEADAVDAVTVAMKRGVTMPKIIEYLQSQGVAKIPQLDAEQRTRFIAWLGAVEC